MGTLYIYTLGLTVLHGFNSVVSTLVSQSYGQGDMHLCGVYLNRGRIVAVLLCIPMTFVMLASGSVFRAFGFDERVIAHASLYIKLLIPMLYFQSQFDVTYKFLNCFSKTSIVIFIQGTTALIHLILCYFIVERWGIVGVSLSTILNSLLNLIIITLWIHFSQGHYKMAWFLPTRQCFMGMGEYVRMGASACFMLALEWWTFDMQSFIGSFVSAETTGIQLMVLNTLFIFATTSTGFMFAGQILIGIAIGEGNLKKAYQFRRLITIIGCFQALLQSSVIFFFRSKIATFFTDIPVLHSQLEDILRIIAIAEFFSCT